MNAGYGYNIDLSKNNDTESNNYYPIIQCTSSGCSSYKENFSDKCSRDGEIIKNNSKYKLCCSNCKLPSVEFEEVTEMIKVENSGDFPGADVGYVLVDITKNEVQQRKFDGNDHYILKDNKMYKCEGNGCNLIVGESNDGITVWEELSSKLYTSSYCSSTGCTWSNLYTKEAITFLDTNHKIFTNKDDKEQPVNAIRYVYKCNSSSVCIELYNFDKGVYTEGYFYNPNHYDKNRKDEIDKLYHCSGDINGGCSWRIVGADGTAENEKLRKCTPLGYKSICYISYGDEYPASEIDGGKTNKVDAGEICENSNGMLYFAFEEVNTGVDKENCLLMARDLSVKYYQIGEDVYLVDKLSAYKLNQYNNPNPENHVSSINNNIILNMASFLHQKRK